MVRRRPRVLRGDDRPAARLPRARALPLPIAAVGIGCCSCCRACPGSARRSTAPTSASSSARCRSSRPSSRRSGSSSSWRATCATRASCSSGRAARRRLTIPPLKHFGPLLVVWGAAMVMLVFIRDLGSSLMFFGGFLAMLYVATNRLLVRRSSGLALFAARGVVLLARPSATSATASTPGSTRSTRRSTTGSAAATRSPSRCSRRPTAGSRARASARRSLNGIPADQAILLPAAQTDLIYAVIVNELGLVGACARAARLPAVRRARLPDRDARARLVLASCWRPA